MYCGAVEFVCSPSMVKHIPVLLDESVGFLGAAEAGRYADLTYGGGGHTNAILGANGANELVSFDCDPDAEDSCGCTHLQNSAIGLLFMIYHSSGWMKFLQSRSLTV